MSKSESKSESGNGNKSLGDSKGFIMHRQQNMQAKGPTLALNSGTNVIGSRKQGYLWPHKTD